MDRRTMLVAAAAGLTLPSLLTTSPSFAAEKESAKSGDYKHGTLLVGTLSKKISEMADQKAKNRHVKDFAGYEIAEQTAIAEVLTNKRDPKPPSLTAAEEKIIQELAGESGETFEKMYIKNEIEGHEKLLVLQKDFLKANGMTSDEGHIARLAEMVITMHLSMLHDLQKMVG